MHFLKIIHFDIKPDNICYSPTQNRHIFIDLGLQKIVKEDLGKKTYTNFRGSLFFCSQ
jgi:serine/threonine protein kinase